MPDIVISEFIDPEPVGRLRERWSVHQDDDLWNTRAELEAMIADASAIIARNRTQVDAALRVGHLSGAAVDVFYTEPITAQTAAQFAGLPNVILTPHIGGLTLESNSRISAITVDNVISALEGSRR